MLSTLRGRMFLHVFSWKIYLTWGSTFPRSYRLCFTSPFPCRPACRERDTYCGLGFRWKYHVNYSKHDSSTSHGVSEAPWFNGYRSIILLVFAHCIATLPSKRPVKNFHSADSFACPAHRVDGLFSFQGSQCCFINYGRTRVYCAESTLWSVKCWKSDPSLDIDLFCQI